MRALADAIEPGLELADAQRVFGLGLLDADGQARGRPERGIREPAPAELREREHRRLEDRCCGDLDGVLQAFGIGERDPGEREGTDSVSRRTGEYAKGAGPGGADESIVSSFQTGRAFTVRLRPYRRAQNYFGASTSSI